MKIIERSNMKGIISQLKSEGKRIVFTNGCFDLLHIGHVRYLKNAKKLGDILIIGLNSDESVSRIKPGRPYTPEGQRAEILAELSAVDYISIFNEDTPYELIKELRPDILVKGADWEKEAIVGKDIAAEVHTIPLTEGVSTSGIIKKIRDNK
jgi:D-beta-D-heptose 7-phosphate kinase/D-beta-D-heptose 1-phosphate adenosyltransferase